jgi:hypothetical protein
MIGAVRVRAFGLSRHALASWSVAVRFRASALLAEHTLGPAGRPAGDR